MQILGDMAAFIIRRLDDGIRQKRSVRAANPAPLHEEEAREILKAGVRPRARPHDSIVQIAIGAI